MAETRDIPRRNNNGPRRGPSAILAPTEKPKDLRKAVSDLFRYLGRARFLVFIVMIFAAASTVFDVLGPKVMGRATTVLAEGLMNKINGTGGIDFDKIAQILVLTLVIYIISSVFAAVEGWIMTGVTQRLCYRLRNDISSKINRMPMKYFEKNPYGDVLSRITNDVDTLGMALNQSVTQIMTAVTTLIGVVVMMLTISPLMTLIAMIMLPLGVGIMGLIMKFSQKHFIAQQEYLGKINGQVEETFAGQMVIKAFVKEEDVTKEFEETNDVLYSSAWKSQFLSGLLPPLMMFVGNLGYVGVAISGGFLAIRGTIGIGDIQAFIQYVKNFTRPMQQVAQVMNQIQSMAAASERVFAFLAEEEEPDEGKREVEPEEVVGMVDFEHVRFGYDPEKIVIKDFNCHVEPGQKIAIVGPTGAGKTTMVKLLMRFYDVNSGAISIDGMDIREFDRQELRESFGMVLQETWLFSGTIMENIRYGRLDATDEEVKAAAKAAHADHFIRTLPGGYDMVINEDATNVSQGQKQLLTIARAILADHKILILDEATSSVDTRTEELIQKAMDNLMAGRTSFIIAHRLSTIKNADLILVMNEGDIIEQGNHEELLEKGGFYADLYNSQFRLDA